MRLACVFNPNSTLRLLARFIREVEIVGGVEAETAARRKDRSGDGGDRIHWLGGRGGVELLSG